jgi:DNA-binding CsgD family transcriptional regulator
MLVGRQREIELLVERLDEQRPVAVVGEAGIGKTALITAAVAASQRRARMGGGLATVSWMTYLPLERALGRRPLEGDVAHVAAQVTEEVGEDVLVIDDVQWADVPTLRVVALVAGRTRVLTAVRRGDERTVAALGVLAEAEFEVLPLEPLTDDDAEEVVLGLRPALSRPLVSRIVEKARGNPLLLEELAAGGEPSETLMLSLARRVRHLSPEARVALTRFVVAGRPIPHDLAGDGVEELVDAGLVEERNGLFEIRHIVLAETLAADLAPDERRAAHSLLARATNDDGTAARHHAGAGEHAEAYEKALRAAATGKHPGERAAHLALAAEVAPARASTNPLLLRAAAALTEGYQPADARRLLDRIDSDDPAITAEAAILRWRTTWDLHGTPDDLQRCIAEGLAAAAGTRTEAEVRLRVMDARTEGVYGGNHDAFRAKAESALTLATELGVAEGYAHSVLGSALMFRAEEGWDRHVSNAIEFARREGDVLAEFTATNTFVYGQLLAGNPAGSLAIAQAASERAHRLLLGAWQRRFRVWEVALLWALGKLQRARELADELLVERLPPGDLDILEPYACQVLVDAGLLDDARQVRNRLEARAAPDQESLGELLWATADLELWSGRPREALHAADDYVLRFRDSNVSETPRFVELTRAWARLELGLPPVEEAFPQRYALTGGSEAELAGIAALARDDARAAVQLFRTAAAEWGGRNLRSELRCAWAEGEALRRAGHELRAVRQLEAVEERACTAELPGVVSRVERSLRQAGVRRSAPRAEAGELSQREHDVLALVVGGLSNAQIARRLGLSSATVSDHVASAVEKLGARNRRQAAALYTQR